MGERSFAEDVKQLGYGAGEVLRGEGILAITKALLQSGVSYVGGYPGAPVSHLLDVLAEACHEPVFFSIRIRACHMRGELPCRDNVRPPISMLSPLERPSFSIERINLPPFTYAMEAQKFEQRLPAARRYIADRRLNEHHRGEEEHLGIVMQGGLWNTTLRGLHVLGLADAHGHTPVPLLVLNVLHPIVPEELVGFLRGKRHVLVLEEGMPNYIEQELKAQAHDA